MTESNSNQSHIRQIKMQPRMRGEATAKTFVTDSKTSRGSQQVHLCKPRDVNGPTHHLKLQAPKLDCTPCGFRHRNIQGITDRSDAAPGSDNARIGSYPQEQTKECACHAGDSSEILIKSRVWTLTRQHCCPKPGVYQTIITATSPLTS